ncbi:MAG: autotransporter outer membrane beta-barrel domain-containing protein [Deltaproteobacteria bacterium]|nr:autotransporter outer membrane beta-barrel domain-containing protein [Deltaproteobacteria bacterium]
MTVDGSVQSDVTGGESLTAGTDGTALSTQNTVTISADAFIGGDVTGGNVSGAVLETATFNTVNILGGTFSPASRIMGGAGTLNPSGSDVFTGNTLNVKSAGVKVGGVENFQLLNFFVPASLPAGVPALEISAGGTARLENGQGTSSAVRVIIDGAVSPLGPGQTFLLIKTDPGKLEGTPDPLASGGSLTLGVTLKYGLGITADNSAGLLTASVTSMPAEADERAKSISAGRLTGLALTAQGADLVSGQGMEAAVSAARGAARGGTNTGFGVSAFAAASAGRSRYDTGSHVDVSGMVLVAGVSFGIGLESGTLTVAPFVEYGTGSFDTFNSFVSSAQVRGSGDVRHAGGGIMIRMDFDGPGPGGLYLEASGRAGRVRTDFMSEDLRSAAGVAASYGLETAYRGVHAGIGYVWDVSDRVTADIYAKYLWTRQKGGTVRLSTGDLVTFGDADSSRARTGFRLSYRASGWAVLYAGAAWEHEFDGEMAASAYGFPIRRPSLRGGTGIGEIGASLRLSESVPLTLELGARGYIGRRKGFSGSFMISFEF